MFKYFQHLCKLILNAIIQARDNNIKNLGQKIKMAVMDHNSTLK